MWVVDMNTFEVRADSNPQHQTEQRKRKTATNSSAQPKAKATKRAPSPVNDTCAPHQLLCRYANKKCLNPRAVKRSGGLHTFCAMHRANANRNQRRLDMRKRLQKQAMRAVGGTPSSNISSVPSSPVSPGSASSDGEPFDLLPIRIPPVDTDALYEPLATPTPLQDEDVSMLVTLFLADDAASSGSATAFGLLDEATALF